MPALVHIRVDSRVRIVNPSSVSPECLSDLRATATHVNPAKKKLERLGYSSWKEPEFIWTWQDDEDGALSFARGTLSAVRAELSKHGHAFRVEDCRHAPQAVWPEYSRDLWEHQTEIIDAVLTKQNIIVRSGTGSGKTSAVLAAMSQSGLRALAIVPSRDLFDQWIERASDPKELGIPVRKIGVIAGGRRARIGEQLTIATQGALSRGGIDDEMLRAFGFVVADEVQLFAAPTFYRTIDPWPAKIRIGVSADERRKDGKHFLTYDLFGEIGVDIPQDDLIEKGLVHDVQVCVVPTDFEAPWFREAMIESTWKQTNDNAFDRLLEEMGSDVARNELVYKLVAWEAEAKRQALVVSHRVLHAERMDQELVTRGIRSGLLMGGQHQQGARRESKEGLKSGRLQVGVGTYQAIGIGTDIPKIAALIATTPIAGNRFFWGQVRGRACRIAEGKSGARLYYLWDRKVYGRRHLENLTKWNRHVVVQDGANWVDGKDYLGRLRHAAKEAI